MFNFLIEHETLLLVSVDPCHLALGNTCKQKQMHAKTTIHHDCLILVVMVSFFAYCHNNIRNLRVLEKYKEVT